MHGNEKLKKVDIVCTKKKVLMYNDDQELILYKKDDRILLPGTDSDSNESLEQAIYHLTGVQIHSDHLVELIKIKNYIKENHPINGKINFIKKELNKEYYSYYLCHSEDYIYELNGLGELIRVPLEKLLGKSIHDNDFSAYEELNKRLTYQKY